MGRSLPRGPRASSSPTSGSLKLILAGSAALAAYLAWWSLGWPLIHDAPLMHYIAWIIGQGGVPYRDVFDMNVPGVYLIHAAVIAVAGRGDLAWRLFDLGWLAATSALLWAYARPLGAGPAAGGALLFALYHLSGGAWRVGQRDFLLCLFLLAGAYGVARSIECGGALRPLVWGGLALGVGMTIKPHVGFFWLGRGGARRLGRMARRALGHRRPSELACRGRSSHPSWCSAGSGGAAGSGRSWRSSPATSCLCIARSGAFRSGRRSATIAWDGRSGDCSRPSPCSARRARRPGSKSARRWRCSASPRARSTSRYRARAGSISSTRSPCFSARSRPSLSAG